MRCCDICGESNVFLEIFDGRYFSTFISSKNIYKKKTDIIVCNKCYFFRIYDSIRGPFVAENVINFKNELKNKIKERKKRLNLFNLCFNNLSSLNIFSLNGYRKTFRIY